VLVIGAGAAGLRAAIELDELGADVLIVGKRLRADAHTVLAAGGINAALGTMDPEDNWAIHAADTLHEGRMLADPVAVELLCREASQAIDELVSYGTKFARGEDGRLLQRYFGAHRYRRTCFAGDYTGRAMIEALVAEVDRRDIPIAERIYITDLLTNGGRVNGALGFRLDDGEPIAFEAGAVILATGGHIHVYRRSSSRRRENTGDGMALALQVGAQLADMELVQFHPTGMVWPEEVEGTLVTEAVRGEGGRLFNARGERFMQCYDAERMELSTRDRIALANYAEIVEGRGTPHGGVWLDISHVPAALIHERLPRMVEQFQRYGGIDITREPMEVAPTAHYSMGGIRVEPYSHSTGVPGLFAAGEATAGVHGANRLGGNSLVECVVFGRRAGEAAAVYAQQNGDVSLDEAQLAEKLARVKQAASADRAATLGLIDDLQQTMWRRAGMVRDAEGLQAVLGQLSDIRVRRDERVGAPSDTINPKALAAAYDLHSMLLTAEATVRAALLRQESRGAHQRRDFPQTDAEWQRTIVVNQGANGLELSVAELPAPSDEVAAALAEVGELALVGRLLE
jgi:succinate dehydrogenase / fumarate reductase flavoprotein subunit